MESYLITGGAGFIGCNLADHFLSKGKKVIVFDNFSRKGVEKNIEWLKERHSNENLEVIKADIVKNQKELIEAVKKVESVFHLAAQVAVTTSVENPRKDFEDNALGTLNVLEAIRGFNNEAILIFSSTNKVYGSLEDLKIRDVGERYELIDFPNGIPESQAVDFHSPYGCSKGTADQYVRDYARIYGLKTVVFRQSCIYGERQLGSFDQGWIAWISLSALIGKPIRIDGTGKQVRDVLYIKDLVNAFEMASNKINKTRGKIFNIGGGPKNTLSLLELISFLEKRFNKKLEYSFHDWRPGDQKVYISDISKAEKEFDWSPKTSVNEGLNKLINWLEENRELFKEFE
jgi:CDP-paratose 2-epimerase